MANGIISYNAIYKIDLLIGSDYYEKIQIEGLYSGNSIMDVFRIVEDQEDEVELSMITEEGIADVNQIWKLETIGLNDMTKAKEDEQLVNAFNNKLVKNGSRYQV